MSTTCKGCECDWCREQAEMPSKRHLRMEADTYRERYEAAIRAAHRYDMPIERTSVTYSWVLVGQGELLDFKNFIYRIREGR